MPEAKDTPSTILHPIATALPPIIKTALAARRPMTARQIASDIDDKYKHMIDRLNENPPNQINPFHAADEDDLILRSHHLRRTLVAVADYVGACVRDTVDSTWSIQFDRKYLDGLFKDIIGDICGSIHNGIEKLREERADHAA